MGSGIWNSALSWDNFSLAGYPLIVTASKLLEESDDESTWCGPPSDQEDSTASEKFSFETCDIDIPQHSVLRHNNRADVSALCEDLQSEPTGSRHHRLKYRRSWAFRIVSPVRRCESSKVGTPLAKSLIHPRGDIASDYQKFVCVFQIGLEDDEEFCLVKRILGKKGNNMRRIAEERSAKVRLRGIGSGFLEGADGKEANMPLQLNVSCSDFSSYQGAVDRIASLLQDLYKHYRRYLRTKGSEPPDLKVSLEEVRRDDLGLDLLQQKAQRSQSQRERDRRAREKERQQQQDHIRYQAR